MSKLVCRHKRSAYPLRGCRLLLLAGAIALVAATLPALWPKPSMGGEPREYYQQLAKEVAADLDSGVYEDAPQGLVDLMQMEEGALDKAVSTQDPHEYYLALAVYARANFEKAQAGYSAEASPSSFEAQFRLYSALSQLEEPHMYASTSKMPGLNYAAFVFAQSPEVIWMLLPLAAVVTFLRSRDGAKSASSGFLSRFGGGLGAWALSIVVAIAILLVAFIPGTAVSTIKNGVGDPSYPVVFIQNGVVMQETVSSTLMGQAQLFVLACAFISAIILLVFTTCDSMLVAALVALALCLAPQVIWHFSGPLAQTELGADILSGVPMTYLAFGTVTGFPSGWFTSDAASISGADLWWGLIVLTRWTVMTLLLSGVIAFVRAHVKHSI